MSRQQRKDKNLLQERYSVANAVAARAAGMLYLAGTSATAAKSATDWHYTERTIYNTGRMADIARLRY